MTKRRAALDTSVLIALVSSWHQHHAATLGSLEDWVQGGSLLLLPSHALFESYAVLTRLPPPYRVAPVIAKTVLHDAFRPYTVIPAPSMDWAALQDFAARGITGGRVYDAAIAGSARAAGADTLLTWNLRDMTSVAPAGLNVRTP